MRAGGGHREDPDERNVKNRQKEAEEQEMLETVKEILAERFGVPKETMTEETQLIRDLGADSLELIRLLMILEEDFGVYIDDEKVKEIRTVGDVAVFAERASGKGDHADHRQ